MPLNATTRFKEALYLVKNDGTLLGILVGLQGCCEFVVTMSRTGTEDERAALRGGLLTAWHDVITPLDIPGIPNSIEPMVDTFIENALVAGVAIGFDKVAELRSQVEAKLAA